MMSEPKSAPVNFLNTVFPPFAALAAILAIRLFLLFAIVGAFILAQTAMLDATNHGIYVLISFCVFTVLPLVWLDVYGKKRG